MNNFDTITENIKNKVITFKNQTENKNEQIIKFLIFFSTFIEQEIEQET